MKTKNLLIFKYLQRRLLFSLALVVTIFTSGHISAQVKRHQGETISCPIDHGHKSENSNKKNTPKSFTYNFQNKIAPVDFNAPATATFETDFDDSFDEFPGARDAVNYALEILAREISSSVPISLRFRFNNTQSAGEATVFSYFSDFENAPLPGVQYPSALANSLAGKKLNDGILDFDITIKYSNSLNWYFGTDANPSSNQFDFVTVTLHELIHGLGFLTINNVQDGIGSRETNSAYNQLIVTEDNLKFTDIEDNTVALAKAMTTGDLFLNGTNVDIVFNNPSPRLYTPNSFRKGSSLSHLDGISPFDRLMNPATNIGLATHNIGNIVRGVLKDMGWKLNNSNPFQFKLNTSLLSEELLIGNSTTKEIIITNLSDTDTVLNAVAEDENPYLFFPEGTSVKIPANSTATIIVGFTTENLSTGFYNVNLLFSSSEYTDLAIETKLRVLDGTEKPVITPTRDKISFRKIQEGAQGKSFFFAIRNKGNADLEYAMTIEGEIAEHLSLIEGDAEGVIAGENNMGKSTSQIFTLLADAENLTSGNYTGTLRINSNDEDKPEILISIALEVITPPRMELSSQTIKVKRVFDGNTYTNIAADSLIIKNKGQADLEFEIEASEDFITVDPDDDIIRENREEEVQITFEDYPFDENTTNPFLTIKSNDPDNEKIKVEFKFEDKNIGVLSELGSLDFGSYNLGQQLFFTLAIDNISKFPIKIDSLYLTKEDTVFTIDEILVADKDFNLLEDTSVIPPGGFFDADLVFTPTSEGIFTNSFVIESEDLLSPYIVDLTIGAKVENPLLLEIASPVTIKMRKAEEAKILLDITNNNNVSFQYKSTLAVGNFFYEDQELIELPPNQTVQVELTIPGKELENGLNIGNFEIATFYQGNALSTSLSSEFSIDVLVPEVTSFTLVNIDTNEVIQTIEEGAIIDRNEFDNITILANVGEIPVRSVVFDFDNHSPYRTDNRMPFALGGDRQGALRKFELPLGSQKLVATAFAGFNAKGELGDPYSINFTVVDSSLPTVESLELVHVPTGENLGDPDGLTIDLEDYDRNSFSIISKVSTENTNQVIFGWNENATFRYDNIAPYTLTQDPDGFLQGVSLPNGDNVVIATPYTRDDKGRRVAGNEKKIEFTVIGNDSENKNPTEFTPALKIYPNPVREQLQFDFSFSRDRQNNYRTQITNLLGQIVISNASFTVENDKGSIDVRSLQKGMYILTLSEMDSGIKYQQKFSK